MNFNFRFFVIVAALLMIVVFIVWLKCSCIFETAMPGINVLVVVSL